MINDPFDRVKLLDLLRPPDGFQLDEAIGTTYSLDLPALLVVPVAFTLFDAEDRDGQVRMQSLEVLESLRRYARKLTVFCHAGRILAPAARFTQFVYLENVVVECLLPNKGSFHPKVWVLRYVDARGDVLYRFLCLTRNLAFDQAWDTALTLEGRLVNRNIARNRPLADFISALPSFARSELPENVRPRIYKFAAELRRVDFKLPPGAQDLGFWPVGIDGYRSAPMFQDGRRVLVMSPFLSNKALAELTEERENCVLISTKQALAEIGGRPSSFEKVYTLKDAATAEPQSEDDLAESGERIASGLHAKCYVVDDGGSASIFTGSANATSSGFHKNVEFLVELIGSRKQFGINALLSPETDTTRLVNLLDEVCEFDPLPAIDEEAVRVEKLLEDARSSIVMSNLHLMGTSAESGKHDLTVDARTPQLIPQGVSITCWPVTFGDDRAVPLLLPASPASTFSGLTTLALTRFLNLEVIAGEGKQRRSRRFTLTLPLDGAPADREDLVLRSLLTDRSRLIQYLLLLVADDTAITAGEAGIVDPATEGDAAAGNDFRVPALLETFLRALDRAPERLDHVQRLVSDLRKTDEGRQLLPPDFDAVWNPVWEARERRRPCPVS